MSVDHMPCICHFVVSKMLLFVALPLFKRELALGLGEELGGPLILRWTSMFTIEPIPTPSGRRIEGNSMRCAREPIRI